MICAHCAKETPIAESRSYLDLTFGLARKSHALPAENEDVAVRTVQRLYRPVCALNWHGAGTGRGPDEPFPGIYPGIELNADHRDAPHPPLDDLQGDLFFCSPTCLRAWLNRLVDEMERMLHTGQVEGQIINPAFRDERRQ